MRRLFSVTVLAATVAAGSGLASVPTAAAATPTTPTVVAIRAGHHPGFDRVVFQLTSLPSERSVRYVSQVISDPKGSPVPVAGRYFAVVRLFPATTFTSSGTTTAAARLTPALPNLRQVVRVGDFEGVLTYALGLTQRVPLHLYTLSSPARVVMDIPVLTWPVLRQGSRGANVSAAQYLLRARGYRLAADGSFGPATRQAVLGFQRSRGLPATGSVGARDWQRLVLTVRSGSRGDGVRAAQVELRKNGYRVAVDGSFGPLTRTAVQRAQARYALPVDGIVGPMTWTALVCRANG